MITPRQAKRFLAAKRDWVGSGQVVSHKEANQRASVCLECPRHVKRDVQELLTGPYARRVKAQLELKAHLHLTVEREEELHTCDICQCYMPLKVWMPLDRAHAVTPDWAGFPEWCWLRTQPVL